MSGASGARQPHATSGRRSGVAPVASERVSIGTPPNSGRTDAGVVAYLVKWVDPAKKGQPVVPATAYAALNQQSGAVTTKTYFEMTKRVFSDKLGQHGLTAELFNPKTVILDPSKGEALVKIGGLSEAENVFYYAIATRD